MRFLAPADALSWVDYPEDSPFPIQNIPFGAFTAEDVETPRACIAIGEYIVDLVILQSAGLIDTVDLSASRGLDALMEAGPVVISELRKQLFDLLHEDTPTLQDNHDLQSHAFRLIEDVTMQLPCTVKSFVDFYSGINHASNVGRMFRPDHPPLLPNYKWVPIGYNGRASSVIPTGQNVTRPKGQTKGANDEAPTFGPTKEMDFELEVGFFVAKHNALGSAFSASQSENYVAGLCIVNDWSARDMQRWEYQPLGPFLAKSFATSISPWLVTLDALDAFRIEGMEQDPQPLDYLRGASRPHFDIVLEVRLQSAKMSAPQVICTSNMKYLYWSIFQQLTHQASNGTNIGPGDLYATGTISGESDDSFGSMLELTWRGQNPITLRETGETRTFLEDGDTLSMTAYAQGTGFRIGFGEVTATILPSE